MARWNRPSNWMRSCTTSRRHGRGHACPHVWVYDPDGGKQASTLDLVGRGQFTILTGINGEAWEEAAAKVGPERSASTDPRPCDRPAQRSSTTHGDWARAREVNEAGCVLVRPGPACLLAREDMADDPQGELRRVLTTLLHRAARGGPS
jgi:2,4-dichlorophenol 6-monooxygenase